jgi:hypothetical protein
MEPPTRRSQDEERSDDVVGIPGRSHEANATCNSAAARRPLISAKKQSHAPHGLGEQMFGAKQQVPHVGGSYKEAESAMAALIGDPRRWATTQNHQDNGVQK